MPKTAAAAHAGHDELLIARLYGSDADDRERARALELVDGCNECAALYADLGAIAKATTALPVPARPRDFALTGEDAARLRPRRRGWARLLGVGRRRSFGGALVAIGFSGLVLTGALSMFGTVATSASLDTGMPGERIAAQAPAASAAQNFSASSAIPSPAATAGPAQPDTSGSFAPGSTQSGVGTESSPAIPSAQDFGPLSSGAPEKGATPNASALAGGGAADMSISSTPPNEQRAAATSQSGIDWMLLVLAGSGLLLALGLVTLLAPAIRRRSARR
ncbi:MAG: hypothetical protein ABSE70_08800 [Candidatus Limnocylindrales bacterium]